MPDGRLLVSYRPTVRQQVGRTVYVGVAVAIVAAAAAFVVARWDYRASWLYLFVLPVLASGCFAVLNVLVRHGGVDATEGGLHRVIRRAAGIRFAPWRQVLDIRTERRGWRTVVVVCLTSGAQWRLRAPYDGRWLSHDPDFEPKLFNLRNLWETHRTRGIGGLIRQAGAVPAGFAGTASPGTKDSSLTAEDKAAEPPPRPAGTG